MAAKWIEPTPEQQEHARMVQHEIVEAINRLGREGFHPAVITAGVGAALCDLITAQHGAKMVPAWFEHRAAITLALIEMGRTH